MFRRQVAIAAVVAPLLPCASCADDGTSLRIECSTAVLDVDGVCLVQGGLDACLGRGIVNVTVARDYELSLVLSSGLYPRVSDSPVMTEPNNLNVESADIEIQDASGVAIPFGALPNPFNRPTSGRVPVGGMGTVAMDAIPRDYMQVIFDQDYTATYGTLIIDAKLLGVTDGDQAVESRHWKWPIELVDTPIGPQNCRTSEDDTAYSCNPGQDLDVVPYCAEI